MIKWTEVTGSTNADIASEKENLNDMSVFAAMFQTSGRGQRGNSWESRPGENLTFSILFKPVDLLIHEQFCISQVASLGVLDFLLSEGIEAKVKWPNDIYVGDRKICGILIENTASGDNLSASIAGIGLNLNQMKFDSDAPNPVSLRMLTGKQYDLKETLVLLIQHIVKLYIDITQGEKRFYLRPSLDGRFLENLYRRGEWRYFEEMPQKKRIRARILGTDNSACLQLEHDNGCIKSYAFKEIRYIL